MARIRSPVMIRPLLAGTYPLQELKAAQEAFLQKRHVGNFVVLPR